MCFNEDGSVDPKGKEDYELTENYMRLRLFSNFHERRVWAHGVLETFWEVPVSISYETINKVIYAYIQFKDKLNNTSKLLLVNTYPSYAPQIFIEEAPSEEEKEDWPYMERIPDTLPDNIILFKK